MLRRLGLTTRTSSMDASSLDEGTEPPVSSRETRSAGNSPPTPRRGIFGFNLSKTCTNPPTTLSPDSLRRALARKSIEPSLPVEFKPKTSATRINIHSKCAEIGTAFFNITHITLNNRPLCILPRKVMSPFVIEKVYKMTVEMHEQVGFITADFQEGKQLLCRRFYLVPVGCMEEDSLDPAVQKTAAKVIEYYLLNFNFGEEVEEKIKEFAVMHESHANSQFYVNQFGIACVSEETKECYFASPGSKFELIVADLVEINEVFIRVIGQANEVKIDLEDEEDINTRRAFINGEPALII